MPSETADRCADELSASLSPMLLPDVRAGIQGLRFLLQELADDPLRDPRDIAHQVTALLRAARQANAVHIRRANVTVIVAEAKRAVARMCPTSGAVRIIERRVAKD